jgi:hypothetical protein
MKTVNLSIFIMKKHFVFNALFFFVLSLSLTGCSVIGDIFKAGMWTAIIGIILLVMLIIWIFRRLS